MEARPSLAPDPVFTPVRSQTAFEETLERLGTAIRLGLIEPGARLPAERDLCAQLGISRSTLRQALTALVQSGHLHAVRGRRGGTFGLIRTTCPALSSQIRSSGKRIVNVWTERQRGMCSAIDSGMASNLARPFMRLARLCASAIRSPPGRSRPGSPSRRGQAPARSADAELTDRRPAAAASAATAASAAATATATAT